MPTIALIPQLFIIAVAFVMAALMLGVVVIRQLPQWSERAKLRRLQANLLTRRAREEAWRAGTDLDESADHLSEEQALVLARDTAKKRAGALRQKGAQDKAARVDTQVVELDSLVVRIWRIRALGLLRVHAAVTSRAAPDAMVLPSPGEAHTPAVLERLAQAAMEARRFLIHVANRLTELEQLVPAPPKGVTIPEQVLVEVETERRRIVALYRSVMEAMDSAADDVDLLVGAAETDAFGALLERRTYLEADGGALNEAVSKLAKRIGGLEQAETDARAQANAVREVDELLNRLK